MAATALAQRDLTAAKLEESLRQLRRYIDSGAKSQRILEKRYEKIESEKEELLEQHYRYAEKSKTPIEDEQMKLFLLPKMDAAEDILNETMDLLETLDATGTDKNKTSELTAAKLEATMGEELILFIVAEVEKILLIEDPTDDDVIRVEGRLQELEKNEGQVSKSFSIVRGLLSDGEIEEYSKKEATLKRILSAIYTKMKLFAKKHTKAQHIEAAGKNTSTKKASMRLEKLKPPKFSNDIRSFARFKADFEAIVKPAYDDETHLTYVLKETCLSGPAYELVKNLEKEEEIWGRLEERYGDSIEIVDAVIQDLRAVTINRSEQDKGVVKLVDVLEKGIRDLTAINKRNEIANAYTVRMLEEKLPRRVMMKWLDQEEKESSTDRFEALFTFLKHERRRLEKMIQQSGDSNKDREKEKEEKEKTRRRQSTFGTEGRRIDDKKKPNNSCLIHQGSSHLTRKCKSFLEKTVAERIKLVTDLKACSLCLSLSHTGKSCPWESKWDPCNVSGCGQYHSRLLHATQDQKPVNKISSNTTKSALLKIQNAKTENGDIVIFWDDGSTISLVRNDYASSIKLPGVEVTYELVTVGNVARVQNTMLYDVQIVDRNGEKYAIQAFGIDEICGGGDENVDTRGIVGLFKNLKAKEVDREYENVQLLIGSDYAHLHPVKEETCGNLVLHNSRFGTGRVLSGQHELLTSVKEVNTQANAVSRGKGIKIEVLKSSKAVDFFTLESLGVVAPPKCNNCKSCKNCTFEIGQLSMCEQRELIVIKQNLKLNSEINKWQTPYPEKADPSSLRDNRDQCEALLRRTEKRLIKNEVLKEKYCEQWQDFIDRGIFKEISEEEMAAYNGPVFYISHHEIFKEGSVSTPLRIVLNSSLKNKDGVCINDFWMKGPNALNNLQGIQFRFRTYQIALVGDLTKMYTSIQTTERERHLRRVLWRNTNLNEKPKTYGVETVMFGDKPAAAISSTAIFQTAEIFKDIDEVAAKKIQEDIYVDDITTGDLNVEKAEKLKQNMTKILSKGGFKVKGFVTSGDSSQEALSLLGSGDVGRVLGIGWIPDPDVFVATVRINISGKFKGARKGPDLDDHQIKSLVDGKLTRRMLLSVTNSCYNVFGIVSPIVVQLKIELKKLYSKELGLSWDADIPQEMKLVWVKLIYLLKSVHGTKFRRCVNELNARGNPELVIFCDGSPLAMCAVAYIRWELQDGSYSTHMFAAKTRVTPLERMTIPRVEMQSAVIAVRLGNSIINSCRYNFQIITYISDSTCTLATLKKDSVALKEYMGNRVAEINASTKPSQWYHVKSGDNIADLGTRMDATAKDIDENSVWQQGPSWLREDKSCWPVSQEVNDVVPEEELSRRGICYFAVVRGPLVDMNKFRSYSSLMRVTARVIEMLKRRSFFVKEVSPSSLEKAERYWVRQSMLYTKPQLEKGNLISLRPKVEEDGVIVLASRAVEGLKLHYNTESFPILMEKDPLARLWMKEVHEEEHSGKTKTAAKSRRKFWIIRGAKLADKIRKSCYKCRLLDKKLESQQMGSLPMFRQSISPVFFVTSVDLFGPFSIKDMVKKRTTMKVWGVIATCASTRAVHLDVAEGYSTDAVLQVLRKFVSLRGCPSKFISDQGSQLKAAAKDTADASSKTWSWNEVKNWAANNKITWEFVPAEAQHQNGLSESLIRSVKRSIKHVIGQNVLSFSEFQLMLFEIANIINSRPIGVISSADPECPNPITPNDVILGRSTNEVPQGPFQTKVSITRRFLYVQQLIDEWWKAWYTSVLPSLVPSYKWRHKCRNVKIGDICLISYKGFRATYRLGRVVGVHHGNDGLVRRIKLEYKLPKEKTFRTVERAIHGVAVIVPVEEQDDSIRLEKTTNST